MRVVVDWTAAELTERSMANPLTKGKNQSRTGNAALTETDVRQIRRQADTTSTRDLAEIYCVGMETIRKIVRRDSWKWVTEEIEFDAPIAPLTDVERAAADASAARVLKMLDQPTEATGLAKLQELAGKEVEKVTKVNNTIAEMAESTPKMRGYIE